MRRLRARERGAVTVYFLLFTLVVLALLVLAVDVGRMYVVQAEIQTAADAAALTAAMQLVGTTNALTHADSQIDASFDSTTGNDNRFNLRSNQIGAGATTIVTTSREYFGQLVDALANTNGGQNGAIDWTTGLYPKYVRVQIDVQSPVMFLPLITRNANQPTVSAAAIAGVSGPICSATGIDGIAVLDLSAGEDPLNFGFVPGGFYTLGLPAAAGLLLGTSGYGQYVFLDHLPAGPQGLSDDSTVFQMGAGGLSTAPDLTPPGVIAIETTEVVATRVASAGTSLGRNFVCGLNTRFAVDPSLNICGTVVAGEFLSLAPLFRSDSDMGAETYAAGDGLQDFATEYDGNMRRVLTIAVVDTATDLNVLNFRQFLLEMAPLSATITQGLNPVPATGLFRAQYIGTPVPIRSSAVGGACRVQTGIGRVVLH